MTGGYTGQVGGSYHGKGGQIVQFDGMGIQHSPGEPGLQPEPGDRAGNGALDERHFSRHQRRRRPDQPGPQGGRQYLLGRRERPLFRQQHAERQPHRRTARRGLTTVTHVRYVFDSGATLGGPIKKDKLWFYFSLSAVGQRAAGGRQVLQRDARHALLHGRHQPAGVCSRVGRVQGHAGRRGGRRSATSSTSSPIRNAIAIVRRMWRAGT